MWYLYISFLVCIHFWAAFIFVLYQQTLYQKNQTQCLAVLLVVQVEMWPPPFRIVGGAAPADGRGADDLLPMDIRDESGETGIMRPFHAPSHRFLSAWSPTKKLYSSGV